MFASGGSDGNNLLIADVGKATLVGGGGGDTLFAAGSQAQLLRAAGGNETLFAGFASGDDTLQAGSGHDSLVAGLGNDTLQAGTGSATMVGGFGKDIFAFIKGEAGGTDLVQNFLDGDKIDLIGYGPHAVADALKTQKVVDGSVTITLSDHTKITFAGVTSLTRGDFVDQTTWAPHNNPHGRG
jgi:Ca2+-binding RTX toxin-like protein